MAGRSWLGCLGLIALMVLTGCASTSRDEAGSNRPPLSLSMTRTVNEDVVPVQSAPSQMNDTQMDDQPLTSGETGVTFYRFKSGDPVVIHLRGIYPKDEAVEDIIDEDGNVTIPLIGDIPAAGKSTSQLESDISDMYVKGGYYRSITVNVVMPSPFYFIRGEIRAPGRFPVVSGVTILQAIAAAGGYTEFASQRSVQLIRGKTTTSINIRDIERNPEKDIRLESGDVIVVNRSIL